MGFVPRGKEIHQKPPSSIYQVASHMAQWVKILATMLDVTLIPSTRMAERTNSHKLASDFHTCMHNEVCVR